MKKKYIVRLTDAERNQLSEVVKKQQGNSQKIRCAQILLQADENELGWTDLQIAQAYHCRTKTVENVRQRFVMEGLERALETKKRENPPVPKLSAKVIGWRARSTDNSDAFGSTACGICQLEFTIISQSGR